MYLIQEITKIEKSFKDPKFMELLADYAKDMADPEVIYCDASVSYASV